MFFRYSNAWERGSNKSNGPVDMDEWVDTTFQDALGSALDDFSDGATLSRRLKGGGKGPGVAQVNLHQTINFTIYKLV